MKDIKLSIIVFAVIALIAAACLKIESVSEIPSIEFTSFEIFDTIEHHLQNKLKAGRLKFKFEDGDGDIGIRPLSDIDTINLKMTLYRKIDGVMQPVATTNPLLPHSAYRIPYLEKVGQSKVIRGEIIITMIYQFYEQDDDTIKYDFYIIDRAGNNSNIEETAEIIVSQNDIYRKE